MAVTQSQTGRFGAGSVNGVAINITEWRGKLHREMAISTDSGNYNATVQQLRRSRVGGEEWIEGTITGNYDFGGTTDANFTQKFNSDGPYPVVLSLTRTVNWATLNADFDDLEIQVTVNGANMITFTANFMSNGDFTLV